MSEGAPSPILQSHPSTRLPRPPIPHTAAHLEDMRVELLLQALVGQVDAELLKGVLVKGLEAIDVQDADAALGALAGACSQGGGQG